MKKNTKKIIKKDKSIFKLGDVVIGLPSANKYYSITKQGWKGKIVRLSPITGNPGSIDKYMTVFGFTDTGAKGTFTVSKNHFKKYNN